MTTRYALLYVGYTCTETRVLHKNNVTTSCILRHDAVVIYMAQFNDSMVTA